MTGRQGYSAAIGCTSYGDSIMGSTITVQARMVGQREPLLADWPNSYPPDLRVASLGRRSFPLIPFVKSEHS